MISDKPIGHKACLVLTDDLVDCDDNSGVQYSGEYLTVGVDQ